MQRIHLILACLIFLVGVATYDVGAWKWGVFSLFLYSLPLIALVFQNRIIRIYALWFGIFLVAQTTLSYFKYQEYHHLSPNLHYQLDVQGQGLPGIHGLQSISTDPLGFRTTKQIAYNKKSEGIRIFTLGASTTELIYLDDHKTWSHLLQEELAQKINKPVEVINASVSGLRLVHVYDNFKKILPYNPDAVLFLIGVNDWNKDILNHFEPNVEKWNRLYAKFGVEYYEATKWYLKNSLLGLAIQSIPFGIRRTTDREKTGVLEEKGEYFTRQNNTLAKTDVRTYAPTEILSEYRTYLEKTAQTCKEHSIKCVFLTQPNAYKPVVSAETKKYFWMTPPNANYTLDLESMGKVAALYNLKLIEFAKERGLALCDLDSQVPPNLNSFYDEVHFNETGSQIVSKILVDCLITANVLR